MLNCHNAKATKNNQSETSANPPRNQSHLQYHVVLGIQNSPNFHLLQYKYCSDPSFRKIRMYIIIIRDDTPSSILPCGHSIRMLDWWMEPIFQLSNDMPFFNFSREFFLGKWYFESTIQKSWVHEIFVFEV